MTRVTGSGREPGVEEGSVVAEERLNALARREEGRRKLQGELGS